MSLDRYEGPGEVQFNSRTLAEAVSISTNIASNSSEVLTMKKGLAGRSAGPTRTEISVESAVPKGGMELEFAEMCVKDADVTITHRFAGKTYIYEGWIDSVESSQSTDSPASVSFSVIAGPPRII